MSIKSHAPYEGFGHLDARTERPSAVWAHTLPVRRRGRPPKSSPPELLDRIRRLGSRGGLFRVHERNSSLYARARRVFGSWSAAVRAAGLDYTETLNDARLRSSLTRRRRSRRAARP